MKKSIEKLDFNSLSYERFIELYFTPEQPVIITNIETPNNNQLTPEKIIDRFYDENNRKAGWFDTAILPTEKSIFPTPDLVNKILNRKDISMRKQPMRVFMQPNKHKTLLHYDGNSLHGLNLQIRGKKDWLIISPDTPVSSAPFNFFSVVGSNFTPNANKHDFYEFSTLPGELLFLPRYWQHMVDSVEKININFNWVFTPLTPNLNSTLGRREAELLKLRQKIPIFRNITVNGDELYGGRGLPLEREYAAKVKTSSACSRLIKELLYVFPLLLHMNDINRQAKTFSKNNFNI